MCTYSPFYLQEYDGMSYNHNSNANIGNLADRPSKNERENN